VAEELHRVELEDRLVDRAHAPPAQNVLEGLTQQRLPLPLPRPRALDGLVERAVDEALDPHLRVRPQERVADEDADPLVDASTERLVERAAQRLLDLARLTLQAGRRILSALEAREDVEVRAAGPVDRD